MSEPGTKSIGFGLKALKRNPGLIPLVALFGTACVGMVTISVYSFISKTDVVLDRQNISPWQRIDHDKRQKLIILTKEHETVPEVEALKKELAIYNTAQK